MTSPHVRLRHARRRRAEVAVAALVALVVEVRHHVTSHVGALAQTGVLREVADLTLVVEQPTGRDLL